MHDRKESAGRRDGPGMPSAAAGTPDLRVAVEVASQFAGQHASDGKISTTADKTDRDETGRVVPTMWR